MAFRESSFRESGFQKIGSNSFDCFFFLFNKKFPPPRLRFCKVYKLVDAYGLSLVCFSDRASTSVWQYLCPYQLGFFFNTIELVSANSNILSFRGKYFIFNDSLICSPKKFQCSFVQIILCLFLSVNCDITK